MSREERKKRRKEKPPIVAEAYCPLSGVYIDGIPIKPHKIKLRVAANGALYGSCLSHWVRVFINNKVLTDEMLCEFEKKQQEEEGDG